MGWVQQAARWLRTARRRPRWARTPRRRAVGRRPRRVLARVDSRCVAVNGSPAGLLRGRGTDARCGSDRPLFSGLPAIPWLYLHPTLPAWLWLIGLCPEPRPSSEMGGGDLLGRSPGGVRRTVDRRQRGGPGFARSLRGPLADGREPACGRRLPDRGDRHPRPQLGSIGPLAVSCPRQRVGVMMSVCVTPSCTSSCWD